MSPFVLSLARICPSHSHQHCRTLSLYNEVTNSLLLHATPLILLTASNIMAVQMSFSNEFQLHYYSEISLFDFNPSPYNLTPPYAMKNTDDSSETIARIQEHVTVEGKRNPFSDWFALPPICRMSLLYKSDDYPLEAYMSPPPLPEVRFTQDLVYLQQINLHGNYEMFIMKWDGKQCLLKTVSAWHTCCFIIDLTER